MADLFISYKREDRRVAERLSIALEQLGFDVWWDFELLSGEGYRNVIEKVIDECATTIVLWSELARNSTFVIDEATYSRDQNKLCPARIDDCRLPLGFGGDHVVDLRGWDGEMGNDGVQNLLRAVEAKTGKKARLGAKPRGENEEARFCEMEAFKAAEAAGNVSALRAFLADYPKGAFANFVRGQLETMGATVPAPATARVGAITHAPGMPPKPQPVRPAPPPQPAVIARSEGPSRKSSAVTIALIAIVVIGIAGASYVMLRPSLAPTTPTPPVAESKPSQAADAYNLDALNAQVRNAVEQARQNEFSAVAFAEQARAAAARGENAGTAPKDGVGVQSFTGQFAGDRYAGEFSEGQHQGVGVYSWGDNPNNSLGALRYEGEFANDAPAGAGLYFWRDGRHYAGPMDGWRKQGAAVMYLAGGRRYEGEYADDKPNGYGVLWDAQGHVLLQGQWTNDQLTTPLS